MDTTKFILKSKLLYGSRFSYGNATYVHPSVKIMLFCNDCQNQIEIFPYTHFKGNGCCKFCKPINASKQNKSNTKEFIEKARKVHGGKYDYSEVIYEAVNNKVIINCSVCSNNFLQTPSNHLQGRGCNICAQIQRCKTKIKNKASVFLERSNKIHNNKYDYSKSVYTKHDELLKIICPVHGEFQLTPNRHLNGGGCQKCGFQRSREKQVKSHDQFISEANIVHDNKYDYPDKYINKCTKINITCSIHGDFLTTPSQHLRGQGCKKCNANISKIGTKWLSSLGIKMIYEYDIPNTRFTVDGYDSTTNTIYEFFGDYWYGNFSNPKCHPDIMNTRCGKTFSQLYIDTVQRICILKNLGYTVKFIWETDFNRGKIFSDNL